MILKCKGHKCPDKFHCLRHMAVHVTGQRYMTETPYDHETKSCKKFARLVIGDEVDPGMLEDIK